MRLGYRPPYDVSAMLSFADASNSRCGVCIQRSERLRVGRTLRLSLAGKISTGWLMAFDPTQHQVLLRVSDSLRSVLPTVIMKLRAALDLDANPQTINAVLHDSFPDGDGLRVPGTMDGYELAVRAVLGQQITVAAARTLAQRIVDKFGEPIETPYPELTRLFPAPAVFGKKRR